MSHSHFRINKQEASLFSICNFKKGSFLIQCVTTRLLIEQCSPPALSSVFIVTHFLLLQEIKSQKLPLKNPTKLLLLHVSQSSEVVLFFFLFLYNPMSDSDTETKPLFSCGLWYTWYRPTFLSGFPLVRCYRLCNINSSLAFLKTTSEQKVHF